MINYTPTKLFLIPISKGWTLKPPVSKDIQLGALKVNDK